MKTDTIHGIKLLSFKNLYSNKYLFHAVSTRIGGVSKKPFESLNLGLNTGDTHENILSNHKALSRQLNFDLQTLISANQIHGSNIITINSKQKTGEASLPGPTFDGFDAIVTDRQDITLIVRVADCVPVILFDPAKKILAVVHAGWKGTKAGISAKAVQEMNNGFGSIASEIIAGIGPSIGPCCFDVRKDVSDLFFNQISNAELFIKKAKNRFFIDLREANRLQLIEQGCRAENIEVSDLCTSCNSHLFFSHRREKGKTGRFGLLAGLRA